MLVGVTGGIGAGKTAVLSIFHNRGVHTLDADDVVHQLYTPGQPVYNAVLKRWGKRLLQADGQLDRAALAQVVFDSQEELQWLNSLVHPIVKQHIQNVSERVPGLVLVAVPLLYEVGWEQAMAAVAAVWCGTEVQRLRLLQRGWTDDEIEKRRRQQLDMSAKLARADYGIINNSSFECLREQCDRLQQRLQLRLQQK